MQVVFSVNSVFIDLSLEALSFIFFYFLFLRLRSIVVAWWTEAQAAWVKASSSSTTEAASTPSATETASTSSDGIEGLIRC